MRLYVHGEGKGTKLFLHDTLQGSTTTNLLTLDLVDVDVGRLCISILLSAVYRRISCNPISQGAFVCAWRRTKNKTLFRGTLQRSTTMNVLDLDPVIVPIHR